MGKSSNEDQTEPASTPELDWEDRLVTIFFAVGLPFVLAFTAFGVIIYAFAEWKLY